MAKKDFAIIPIEQLVVWDNVNARHTNTYDGIEVLASNIKEVGVLVPLVVTPFKEKYRIISGQRRFIAAKKAGQTEIPCRILYNVDETHARILSFSENIYRTDMNEEDKSTAVMYLKEELGTVDGIAEKLGVSKGTIYNYLRYQNVPPTIKEMVNKGELNRTTALAISMRHPDDPEFAYQLAKDYAARGNDKAEYFAAIKESPPGSTIEDIRERFNKRKSTTKYTIRLPNTSSKVITDISSQTNTKPELVLVQLIEESIELWKKQVIDI